MEAIGRLKGVSKDWQTDKLVLSVEIDSNPVNEINELADKDLSVNIIQFRQKRSLDANAYFHVLCDRLRQKLDISMARCKNVLIGRYGQVEYLDNEPVVIKTNIPVEKMMEQETLHCMPCGVEIQKGKEINFFRVYRGSHTYDTAEMSKLIDGTVDECRQVGIDTATPKEIERMLATWKSR